MSYDEMYRKMVPKLPLSGLIEQKKLFEHDLVDSQKNIYKMIVDRIEVLTNN